MRLLTFNTLFRGDVRARLTALGALLERADFDVVCLQEVMFRRGAELLRRRFPFHAYTGNPLLRGGLVLLSRLPIADHRFTRYPVLGHPRGEWLMRKGFQSATIGGVIVVNTHLSANRDGDWSPGNRYTRVQQRELDVLATAVAALGPDRPLAVVGDLNVPRTSPQLREFLAATGLRDVLAGDTRPTYRPTPRFPRPPAFDHVLVRHLRADADLVLQEPALSDHYGVAAQLLA